MITNQKSIQLLFTNSNQSHVTVVIPADNSGKFLPAAIESAVSQTDPDVEIIVVDDGSTDDTKLVCNRYQGSNISSASAKMLIGAFAVQRLEQGYIPQQALVPRKLPIKPDDLPGSSFLAIDYLMRSCAVSSAQAISIPDNCQVSRISQWHTSTSIISDEYQ
jgi:glycosyltransferase involved in cell wall biosynthesis